MHGVGHTVQASSFPQGHEPTTGNRFCTANGFFEPLPAPRTGTEPGEVPKRLGPPRLRNSGGGRSRPHASGRAYDRCTRAGNTRRPSAMDMTGPCREARSHHHEPIRNEGSGPHACRARLGRTKGPARLPAAGNRCCEEDREVFPQTEFAGLWEDLAHSTDLQTGQATQRVTRPLRSNLRRSQWREVQ
jgi:hypothetical protein